MTTALRNLRRAGRFGRELRGDEPQAAPEGVCFDTASYVIDADAVAAAIVDRLLVGRTLAVAPPRRRQS